MNKSNQTPQTNTEKHKELVEHIRTEYHKFNLYHQAPLGFNAAELADKFYADLALEWMADVEKAKSPSVDLNDPQYQLENTDNPVAAFNLFIQKWCPHAAHLLDNDENDGEYMRGLITTLTTKPNQEKS